MIKFKERKEHGHDSGIYGIKNIVNGKIYIGQTIQPFYKRYQLHDWKLRSNQHDNAHLQYAYNKYGENNFEFIIIESAKIWDRDELNELEIKYISLYKDLNLSYNILNGGDGHLGVPLSDEAKKKIGNKNRQHMLGRKHSEATKEKMRQSSPHKKMSEENKQKLKEIRTGTKHSEEVKLKMKKSHLGSKNKHSVLDEKQVVEIKEMLMTGLYTQSEIATKFNVHYKVISSIYCQKVWNHVFVEGFDEYVKATHKVKSKPLNNEQVVQIRQMLKDGIERTLICENFKITPNTLYNIESNRAYKNVL